MRAIKVTSHQLWYLDQKQLPRKEVWRQSKSVKEGVVAIKELRVRGAPLIGVFAAYVAAFAAQKLQASPVAFRRQFERVVAALALSRPTAVNLAWALHRLEDVLNRAPDKGVVYLKRALMKEARAIHQEDIRLCARMGAYGARLVTKGDQLLTHCNAGALATSGMGTALAVFYQAHKLRKNIHVYVDETRPLLQGARLTAWELTKGAVPCTLITDTMAAYLMQQGKIDKIFVGADRIAANGDIANKIGTYSVAVAAAYHKIPVYIVAPFSTFDLSLKSGKDIPIEERQKDEVRCVLGKVRIAPQNVGVYNPAFDVTPHALITALVTDRGVIVPPFTKNIKKMLCR